MRMSYTFTDDLKEEYKKVCIMNRNQSDIYYCAVLDKTPTPRNLDLESPYVFCEKDSEEESKKSVLKEYKLQAFLVKQALMNENWFLPINDDKNGWKLLDSERNFSSKDLCEEGEGKRLDILAYEAKTSSYIVLELKPEREFKKAINQLLRYVKTINMYIDSANNVYSVDAKKVKGYIVWPFPNKKSTNIQTTWGLIEFNKDFLKAGNDINKIKFKIVKKPD